MTRGFRLKQQAVDVAQLDSCELFPLANQPDKAALSLNSEIRPHFTTSSAGNGGLLPLLRTPCLQNVPVGCQIPENSRLTI